MLNGLTDWWKEPMRDLVPASLRPFGRAWRRVLVAVVEVADEPSAKLFLQGRNGEIALGQYGLNGTGLREALARLPKTQRKAAMLEFPADLLLERGIVLPQTAEQDLRRVVAYEMDRLTPFRADEVLWTCMVEAGSGPQPASCPCDDCSHYSGVVFPGRLATGGARSGTDRSRGTMQPRRVIPLADGQAGRAWLGPRPTSTRLADAPF